MSRRIQRVTTSADLTRFIQLPYSIYEKYPLWVPPLEMERRRFLDPAHNPFFKHATVDHFLLTDETGRVEGRISAIEDQAHNEFHKEKVGFFGMFECVDDPEAVSLLLDTARTWCADRGLTAMRGPFNLSTNHECGLLIQGFDLPPLIGMPYNPPYYASRFEEWGLEKCKDLLSMMIEIIAIPDYMQKASKRILDRGRFTVRTLKMNEFSEELERVWDIYNSAWNKNWGFVPMDHEEFMFSASELKNIIQPDLCFLVEVQGEPAAFSLSLPDINQVLKKMKGRLFPFGIFHFLFGKKHINMYRTLTLGVKPKYRRLGMDTILIQRTYQWYLDHGIKITDQSWVLEDNQAMLQPIERVGGQEYKRHRIYERSCDI